MLTNQYTVPAHLSDLLTSFNMSDFNTGLLIG